MLTLFFNGHIITQNVANPLASVMVVSAGEIVAIGDDRLLTHPGVTSKVNLHGNVVVPGFNDAHVHVWKVGQLESFIVDLRGVTSISELQSMVREAATFVPPGKWIVGRGFNEQVMEENRMPVKEDLDAISTDHPIYLIRTCAHIAVVNSLALDTAGVQPGTPAPQGGVVGKQTDGSLSGIFYETALGLITQKMPAPSKDDYKQMIKSGISKLLRFGITSATDPAVHPELLDAYYELHAEGALAIRLNLMPILLPDGGDKPFSVPPRFVTYTLRVDTVKFFSDGGLSGKTASLTRSYNGSTDKGVLRLDRLRFLELATDAQQKGFRIGTHAIGDQAIDLVIEVYKDLSKQFGNTRNRIEHFGLPTDKNIEDMASHGFVAVPQPIFLDELGENFIASLDDGYLQRCYPVRTLIDKGINVAFSTDAPVVKNVSPLSCIKSAVTRKTSKGHIISGQESVTVREALYAYTKGGAFAEGMELKKGMLEVGALADFVVLDGNPLEADVEKLDQIQILSTYVAGVCRYQA